MQDGWMDEKWTENTILVIFLSKANHGGLFSYAL
jgi:hypothetical protein